MNNNKSGFRSDVFLERLGYSAWNALQVEAFNAWQKHENVCVLAPTGSGKSAAFIRSILSQLKEETTDTQCIVIAPTRELVIQIAAVFQRFQSGYKVTALYGGHKIGIEQDQLTETPAVIIATPGRLEDHFKRGNLKLDARFQFVVDEYDQCLSLGFEETIESIRNFIPEKARLFFTSATEPQSLNKLFGDKPFELIDMRPKTAEVDVRHFEVPINGDLSESVVQLIGQLEPAPTIIFCNLREEVDYLSDVFSSYKIPCQPFHGGMEQDHRERALIQFRHYSCHYLICTDLGSRGLDIPDVQHIIHYRIPDKAESFVHRIGRTARQGKSGNSYFFRERNEEKADFLPDAKVLKLKEDWSLPKMPEWVTLYISGGKRDKVNKVDLVGFFCQQGGLTKEQIGTITVRDNSSYVALPARLVKHVLGQVQSLKIKGKKYRIAYSR